MNLFKLMSRESLWRYGSLLAIAVSWSLFFFGLFRMSYVTNWDNDGLGISLFCAGLVGGIVLTCFKFFTWADDYSARDRSRTRRLHMRRRLRVLSHQLTTEDLVLREEEELVRKPYQYSREWDY